MTKRSRGWGLKAKCVKFEKKSQKSERKEQKNEKKLQESGKKARISRDLAVKVSPIVRTLRDLAVRAPFTA